MPTALYPGTFDPITYGHIDIATRASRIFRRVIAVVADNPGKNPLFSAEERLDMVRDALGGIRGIRVVRYSGLIVQCLKEYRATFIIRGLRALSDVEYEFQMAFTNRKMHETAETVFLMPSAEFIYLNSSTVKQVAELGGDITAYVPGHVRRKILEKYAHARG